MFVTRGLGWFAPRSVAGDILGEGSAPASERKMVFFRHVCDQVCTWYGDASGPPHGQGIMLGTTKSGQVMLGEGELNQGSGLTWCPEGAVCKSLRLLRQPTHQSI